MVKSIIIILFIYVYGFISYIGAKALVTFKKNKKR